MSRFERSIDINATPALIWAALTDFAAYPQWNPFIRQAATEDLNPGGRIRVTMQPQGHSATRLRPTLLVVKPELELRWRGHVLIPGLFDGEHSFRLAPLADGTTRFTQAESFSGVLLPLLGGTLRDTEASFDAMNQALKAWVEARAGMA